MKRHPRLAKRVTHGISRKKAAEWTRDICDQWIGKLSWLHANGYLDNPSGLWNLDESAFSLAEIWKRVIAVRGMKKVTSYIDGDSKERLTVLAAGNAAGLMLPPLILYDGKRQLMDRLDSTNDECAVAVNASGWMDDCHFTAYVEQFLLPRMTAPKVLDLLIDWFYLILINYYAVYSVLYCAISCHFIF